MLRLSFAVLLLLFQTQKPADVRVALQARYDAWSKAYMANDVDTLLSILAPDYTLKTSSGTEIKRSEYEATLKLRKAANSDTKQYSTKILKLKLTGQTAEVISREAMTARQKNEKTGGMQNVVHEHDYTDTWSRD